jgi:hypothetical protein
MSLGVDDLNTLSTYVNGVIDRADHHASRVNAVVLALLGAVIWRKADGVSIEILWAMCSGLKWLDRDTHFLMTMNVKKSTCERVVFRVKHCLFSTTILN